VEAGLTKKSQCRC